MAKKRTTKQTAKKTPKKSASARAPGKTQISISLAEDLLDQIDAMAATENRNRSNYIANALTDIEE